MWLRFTLISALKWCAQILWRNVVLLSVLPDSLHGYYLALPIWFAMFLNAVMFAYWALYPVMPTRRDVIRLTVIWVVVSYCLELAYTYYSLGDIRYFVGSLEAHLQYLFEIFGIVLGAQLVRRRHVTTVLLDPSELPSQPHS